MLRSLISPARSLAAMYSTPSFQQHSRPSFRRTNRSRGTLSLGRNFGLAWQDVINVPGDLNFDSVLNAQDWLLFIANSETNMTAFSAIERYDNGDLDGDGKNSLYDFVLFKQHYDFVNGAGTFSTMLISVPEPSGSLLACVAVALAIICSRRRAAADSLC